MVHLITEGSVMEILERIQHGKIVPVIALERVEDAVPLCQALEAGGLTVAEITFRTKAAREAIKTVAREFPQFTLGAGTVTTLTELEAALAAGAGFAVAPGFNPRIVRAAQELGLPFFPGVANPSDIEGALELGCETLKFFPAAALGGPKMIKAIYAPYKHRGIRFIPTGGIELDNMNDYLQTPGVIAIGGSWIVSKKWLDAGAWSAVTEATRQAVLKARETPAG
jgi:2-dehydro-3-deoxyphosphogluconate aldolase / (4S)-4-hydroxy-2-oxoglutarate aldolase